MIKAVALLFLASLSSAQNFINPQQPGYVSGSSVTAFQGGVWSITASPGAGPTTVTPGTGTWNVTLATGAAFPVTVTGVVQVASTGTTVSTGSITAFQGGTWNIGSITSLPALADGTNIIGRVNGSTIAIQCLNAAGTAFESCAGGGSSSGITSVYVSSGSIALSSGSYSTPFYVISTNTVVSTGSVTAFAPGTAQAASIFHNVRLTDGSGFYTAGSGSGGATTVTPGTGTFSVALSTNGSLAAPFYTLSTQPYASVGATTTIQGSGGAGITATGNSLNVNCTGGCGSPTQAVSFVAVATVTITQGATHFTLMNHSGSTVTIKVQRVDIAMYSDAAVTGVVAGYQMYLITATTVTGNGSQVRFHRVDTDDNNIAPGVTLSTGGAATIPTIAVPSVAFAATAMTSEETTLVDPAELYNYRNLGDKPLVLRAGQGFTIKQAPLPAAAAGKVIIRAFITQE